MTEEEHKHVTLVITSCGRHDLLKRTVDSFELYNTYDLSSKIIINDSGDEKDFEELKEMFPEFIIIHNLEKKGQIASIDKAYEYVGTEYVFHCEDDWVFNSFGFIEKSLAVMEKEPNVIQVHLRAIGDLNGHPVDYSTEKTYDSIIGLPVTVVDLEFDYMDTWNGFSFNPGLKRMSDYKSVKKYTDIGHESAISRHYKKLGYRGVVIKDERHHVAHIGWGRHVEDLHSEELSK